MSATSAAAPGCTVWDELGRIDEGILARGLQREYPQTAAVILARLDSARAAKVLALMPSDLGAEIMVRMLHLESLHADVLDALERAVREEFLPGLTKPDPDGIRDEARAKVAEIAKHLPADTAERLLPATGTVHPPHRAESGSPAVPPGKHRSLG